MKIKDHKTVKQIYRKLKKDFNLTELEIDTFLNKAQKQYFGLSAFEFIKLNIEVNSKVVLDEIRIMKYGEAMGA